ncbi:MAG: hypothetical protein GXY95_04910 [Clostridiales bacterium]|jgi:hypothetical protein|nr:hypothetical protein [Clostridiales bacterium]HOA33601.1 hypothetical protein [Clostridiales bacterium]HOJ36432.1 hypothetical protein [Clostridiales bacterium]HOL79814.1 hypothetical protein [Clostridiales bacterium]HPP67939.1 hypothetical protein [Clostridiales bacterium]
MANNKIAKVNGNKALTYISKTLDNIKVIDTASKTIKFLSYLKIAVGAAAAAIVVYQLYSVIKSEMK